MILSVLYIGFGLTLYCSERSPLLSTTKREPLLEESKRSTNDRLFKFWIALVIVVALLLGSVFAIDRAAQQAANHQSHYKLNTCVGWSTAAWVIITIIGMLTLKARGYSTKLLTGTFYGCLAGFSVLSVVFTVYFVGAVSNLFAYALKRGGIIKLNCGQVIIYSLLAPHSLRSFLSFLLTDEQTQKHRPGTRIIRAE